MKNQIIEQALLSSKTVFSSIQELPKLSAIKVEFLPATPRVESYFSDALHLLSVTQGHAPTQRMQTSAGKTNTGLVKHVA